MLNRLLSLIILVLLLATSTLTIIPFAIVWIITGKFYLTKIFSWAWDLGDLG